MSSSSFIRFGRAPALRAATAGTALTLAFFACPLPSLAQETVVIPAAGTATWDEIVRHEALVPRAADVARDIPALPAPGGYDLGPPRAQTILPAPPQSRLEAPPGAPPPSGPGLTNSFLALPDNNTLVPPDTNGAAGPNHLMTMLNTEVRIQNLSGGVVSTVSLATFWTSGTGLSGTPFDPRVQYDAASGRWIAVVDADINSATSAVWLAVSATNDPTMAWTFFAIPADAAMTPTQYADFPGLGINNTWIAITNNMYPIGSSSFQGAKMWVIDKSTALSGGPLTVTVFATGFSHNPVGCVAFAVGCFWWSFAMQPAHTFGASGTLYIVDATGFSSSGQALLRMTQITGTAASPVWAVTPDAAGPFTGSGFFLVANNFDYSHPWAVQSSSAALIRLNEGRISTNTVFRNGHLWATHHGGRPAGANDRVSVLWYELDPPLLQTTGNPIVQSGVVDGGSGTYYYYPSLAVNALDDVVVGFSRSDSTIFAEAAAATRFGTDTPGTMTSLFQIKAGEDSYEKTDISGTVRWGDYSATVIDPADDLSFWTIQEYAAFDVGPSTIDDRWGTWWAFVLVTTTTSTTTTSTTTTTTSTTSTTLPPGVCAPSPATSGCLAPGKAQLLVIDKGDDTKDKLKWKWLKGDAVDAADLGNPLTTTTYWLCVYDRTGGTPSLATTLAVSPGAGWTDKLPKGFDYKDKTAASDGVDKIGLRTGLATKSKAQLGAKGLALPMPMPLSMTEFFDQDPDVTVQLFNDAGTCWTSVFTTAKKNTATLFKASTP